MFFNTNSIGVFKRNRVSKADRPVIRPEMTPTDWLMEAFALAGIMVLLGYVIYYYPKLPATIPSHFNGTGAPDEYSGKDSFLFLPGVSIFVYILLSLIVLIPHQFNYTIKITPANALRQYALAIRLIRYLKAAVIWLFFYSSYAIVRVAEGKASGLGLWFLPVVLGGLLVPVVVYFFAAFRNR
jgi:uncharacterized membrane protein